MKKVLSLLLACAMIFSLSTAIVANAAGEGYSVVAAKVTTKKVGPKTSLSFDTTATDYVAYTHYTDSTWENTEEAVAMALQISTNTAANGGYIIIDYDEDKVVPAAIVYADGSVYGQTYSAIVPSEGVFTETGWVQSAGTATITENAATAAVKATDVAEGHLLVTWTGAMSAGEAIANVTFFCKSGVTAENFDNKTFAITSSQSFLDSHNRFNGAASIDTNDGVFKMIDGTCSTSITYPNSDKGDDPVVTESCVVAEGVATVTAVYNEDVAGTAIIAVYDADGRMIAHKVGDAVSGKNFTIATDAFEGTAKTVKVFVWDNVGSKNTAKVSAKSFPVAQ